LVSEGYRPLDAPRGTLLIGGASQGWEFEQTLLHHGIARPFFALAFQSDPPDSDEALLVVLGGLISISSP